MTVKTLMALCWIMARLRWRPPYLAEHLMIGVLWAAFSGCSQDRVSIITASPCAALVAEGSESMLGLVGSPEVSAVRNGSSVALVWDASSNTLGYRLYIGTSSRSYQQVADIGLQTKSMISNLVGDMTYYFAVTAYNSAGESCPSNEVTIRIP